MIFVALALYRLFKGVDRNLAVLMRQVDGNAPELSRRCMMAGRSVSQQILPTTAVASFRSLLTAPVTRCVRFELYEKCRAHLCSVTVGIRFHSGGR